MAAAVTRLLVDGRLEENIDHLRATYAARMKALVSAVRIGFPGMDFISPQGGYFLWVPLHAPSSEAVTVLAGERCGVAGGCRGWARLSVSLYDPPLLREGVRRLAEVARPSQAPHSRN